MSPLGGDFRFVAEAAAEQRMGKIFFLAKLFDSIKNRSNICAAADVSSDFGVERQTYIPVSLMWMTEFLLRQMLSNARLASAILV